MIWGKTDKEKDEIKRRKALKWFAWRPVPLKDGRWCWWEYVSYKHHSVTGLGGHMGYFTYEKTKTVKNERR